MDELTQCHAIVLNKCLMIKLSRMAVLPRKGLGQKWGQGHGTAVQKRIWQSPPKWNGIRRWGRVRLLLPPHPFLC